MPPYGRGLDSIGRRGRKIARGAIPVITPSSDDPTAHSFGVVLGDASSNLTDFNALITHLNTRRNALKGTTGEKHKLQSVRIDMQWQGWENPRGTRSIADKKPLIKKVIDEGMVPLLGTWFVPVWASRKDIEGMASMRGTPTSSTVITMDDDIPKGQYNNILLNGPGIPAGGKAIVSNGTNTFTVTGGVNTSAAAGNYTLGGPGGAPENQKLLLDPSHYVHTFESFKWLAEQLDDLDGHIIFELSNEGNHVPYSRPRAYPELFCRSHMYMWLGMMEGSDNTWQKRHMCPVSTAHSEDNLGRPYTGPVFDYPDFTTGPPWLSPQTYYKRYIDEMERKQSTWATLRAETPSGADMSARTNTHTWCRDYATHAYTNYRKGPYTAGENNMINPGASTESFGSDGPEIHNYGYNKGGTLGAQLREWLVHYTENAPGWGEVNDNNGFECTIGLGFTGSDPTLVASVNHFNSINPGGGTQKARQTLHPHESFNYIMWAWWYMTGRGAWPGTAWACGENMMGTYTVFRIDGTIAEDPIHQTLACFAKHNSNPPVFRGEITRTVGNRTGVTHMDPFTGYPGYSVLDALAVLD